MSRARGLFGALLAAAAAVSTVAACSGGTEGTVVAQEPDRRRLRLSCRRRDGRPGGGAGLEGVRGSHVLAGGRPR
jgi:hypothetical protein